MQVQVLLTADFNFCVRKVKGAVLIRILSLKLFYFFSLFLTSSSAIGIKKAKNSGLHVI